VLYEFLEKKSSFQNCFRGGVVEGHLFRERWHVHALKNFDQALPQYVKLAKAASNAEFNYFIPKADTGHIVLNVRSGLKWVDNRKQAVVLTNRVVPEDLENALPVLAVIRVHLDILKLSWFLQCGSVGHID